ncbi:R3H domain containing 4, variant 2 [Chamberlinius hualienensis]
MQSMLPPQSKWKKRFCAEARPRNLSQEIPLDRPAQRSKTSTMGPRRIGDMKMVAKLTNIYCILYSALMMLDSLNTEEFDEVSIGDFMSSRISAFSKLLEERRNLKLWKDFINCSEEKQAVMLSSCTEAHGNAAAMSSTSAKKSAANHREVGSADVSFHRVGSGFRALIKKKQISMGILSHMENELIDFFTNWPKSVYVSQLPNGYERLILHALCQYLDLIAQSFSGKGSRQTRVENRHQVFSTPPILLTKFLEDNFRL